MSKTLKTPRSKQERMKEMKGRFTYMLAGFVAGVLLVVTFNSLDKVAAFEVRQSAETMILGQIE